MKSSSSSCACRTAYAFRLVSLIFTILIALCLIQGEAADAADVAAKPAAPKANFTATPTTGQAPVTVTFTDRSTGAIKSWLWSFGDGGSSTAKSPSHLYKSAGKYTVTLTVTAPGGTDSAVKAGYITVQAPVPPPPVDPPPVDPPPVDPPPVDPPPVVPPPVQPPVDPPTTPPATEHYQIHVDSAAHQRFGLYYPVTYKFRLPAGSINLRAEFRTGDGAWSALVEKKSSDFFNGIDAARFDYTNGFAYLSARFSAASDDLSLRVLDASGFPVPLTFDSIPQYYDDRKAVVSLILDDWNIAFDSEFSAAISYLVPRNINFTVAVIAADVNFPSVQQKLDQYGDLIEVASHGLHHACSAEAYTASGYAAETSGSRDALDTNLSFMNKPYVPVYVEPCGYSDTSLQAAVTAANYLVVRSSNDFFGTGSLFIPWDATQGRYGRAGVVYNDDRDGDTPALLANANAGFDKAIAAGGIYALMDHPEKGYWHDNSYLLQHIDRIKGRTDLWYVPFGHLYQYHFLQEKRGNLTIQHIASQTLAANFSAVPLTGKSPLPVSFSDTSTGTVSTWLWEFGDGSVSTQQNPQHTYSNSGSYTVKLTVNGPQGTDTRTVADYIKVDVQGGVGGTVSIKAPVSGATFPAPATIPISASATAASGSAISKVDFYAGMQLIGSATAPPYNFTWTNVASGTYVLVAEQKETSGAVTRSAPVGVAVTAVTVSLPAAPTITSVTAANGHADIAFTAPASDGGSPITDYTVAAFPGNLTASGTASPLRVSGLNTGTAYSFTVMAKNALGNGVPSALSGQVVPLPNGDLNGDDAVTMSDGMMALRIVLGLDKATAEQLKGGDVAPLVNGKPNPDGKIDIADVMVILRRALGLVSW